MSHRCAATFFLVVSVLFACAATAVPSSLRHFVKRTSSKSKRFGIPGPGCPPRPPIPANPPRLPQFFVDYIAETVANHTVSACNTDPLPPGSCSATAMAMAVVVGPLSQYVIPDHTSFRNFGCLDKKKPTGGDNAVTEDTIFRLASVSKTFTVEMVLDAVKYGRIRSWDDSLDKYFPDLYVENPFDLGSQPTFKHMCSQLAGLPRASPCGAKCPYTTEEMMKRIADYTELIHPLNSLPSYSNLGYSILGNMVAERLFGVPYETLLVDGILRPLGLGSSGMNYTEDVRKRMAVEYGGDGSVAPWVTLGWDDPSGGLYSTARDMAEWARHFLADWAASPWRRETMQPIHMNGDGMTGFGAPWEYTSSHGYLVRTKSGDLPGVAAHMALVPELSLAMVFLWNGEGIDPMDMAQIAFDTAIPVMVSAYQKAQIDEFPAYDDGFCDVFCNQTYSGKIDGETVKAKVFTMTNSSIAAVPFVVLEFPGVGGWILLPTNFTTAKKKKNLDLKPFEYAFQLMAPYDPSQACMWPEFLGQNGEWAYFSHNAKYRRPMFIIPGMQPTAEFVKER